MSTIMNDSKAGGSGTRTQISPIDKFASVALLDTDELESLLSAARTELETRGASEVRPAVEERTRPAWADVARDEVDRRHNVHPDEQGVWLFATVDGWTVEEEDQDGKVWTKKVLVELQGFRHDRTTIADWPDSVLVDIEDPGEVGSHLNNPQDMRRLAAALVKAADLLEGKGE